MKLPVAPAGYRLIQLAREGHELRAELIAGAVRIDLATATYETEVGE